jgi:hypothetical protein
MRRLGGKRLGPGGGKGGRRGTWWSRHGRHPVEEWVDFARATQAGGGEDFEVFVPDPEAQVVALVEETGGGGGETDALMIGGVNQPAQGAHALHFRLSVNSVFPPF